MEQTLSDRIDRLYVSICNICAMSQMQMAFPDTFNFDYGLAATPSVVYINREREHASVLWDELRPEEIKILESVETWRPAHPTKHPLEMLADAAE